MAKRVTVECPALAPPDRIVVRGLAVEEGVSRLGRGVLDVVMPTAAVDPAAVLGKDLTAVVQSPAGKRYFRGVVVRVVAGGGSPEAGEFRLEFAPWLWLLTLRAGYRVFQEKTIPDVVKEVFGGYGAVRYEFQTDPTAAWDYCVQYRETDFNFVSRLLEQEGLFYYFRNDAKESVCVVANRASAYRSAAELSLAGQSIPVPLPGLPAVVDLGRPVCRYGPDLSQDDRVVLWEHAHSLRSGGWKVWDYTPVPQKDGGAAEAVVGEHRSKVLPAAAAAYQVKDFPAEAETKAAAEAESKVRVEEEEAQASVVSGSGTYEWLSPGGKFELAGHPNPKENGRPFVVLSVRHQVGGAGSEAAYTNQFTCIPADRLFRAPRTTPKPVAQGVQTARVVGPDGQHVHTDALGRVKLHFAWDEKPGSPTSSCWLRCAQPIGTKAGGAMAIPRVGQEVVVSFLDGDPDRPLVTGTVYTTEQKPPHPLPAGKAKTYWRTTSVGGEAVNELCFDDEKGKEAVRLRAGHDLEVAVENDHTVVVAKGAQKTHLKAGSGSVKLDKGEYTIEAAKGIVLKVGDNVVRIDQKGITLKALKVVLVGSVQVEVSAPMAAVKSDGVLQLKGGVVTLN